MIFVSVGMQMPFNRLCKAIDDWAEQHGRNDIFMQIGDTDWQPKYCRFENMISPTEFRKHIETASLLVMHAGIGSIVTGMECGVPMLLMPRLASLRETRNEHQTATAEQMKNLPGITIAKDEYELAQKLANLDLNEKPPPMGSDASPNLIRTIRQFIEDA